MRTWSALHGARAVARVRAAPDGRGLAVFAAPPERLAEDHRMKTTMPTPEQVRQLPLLTRVTVPPDWEDINGHVNVQHHLGMYSLTNDAVMEMLGVSSDWVRTSRIGLFDLEHHIWFLNEAHVGDRIALYMRFTERNARRVAGLTFLLNETRDCLASVIEFVSAAADLTARRTVALPEPIGTRLDGLLEAHASLAWPAPRSGAVAV